MLFHYMSYMAIIYNNAVHLQVYYDPFFNDVIKLIVAYGIRLQEGP